ncbi:MAG: biotin/lipoyl-containing protein, partial [Polyangiaceae bacterium]
MAKILDMPKLSPTMEEGLLALWHKKEGDSIVVDDLLAEVETDKATMEFRSFDKGTLLKILVAPGSTVKLGQPVAIIGEAGENFSALLAQVSGGPAAAPAPTPAPVVAAAAPAPSPAQSAAPTGSEVVASSVTVDGRIKASPFVRKVAREHGIDLTHVAGSGPNGRVVARDLPAEGSPAPAHAASTAAPAPAPAAARPA